jgi:hypothetical protein
MTDTTNPQAEPWWAADGRLKPHALPAATTPDGPSLTGGFDDSVEIPDLPAVPVPAPAPTDRCPHGCDVSTCPCLACEADQTALRDRIAEALYEHDHPGWRVSLRESDTEPVYQTRAAAVLPLFAGHDSPATVPPAPADQTAPLTLVDRLIEHCPDHGCVEPEWEDGCHCEIVPLLRRLADAVPVSGPGGAADETRQDEAQPLPAITLTDAERQFLTFALDQAADEMSLADGFTADDEAALEKLRRLADGEQQPETQADDGPRCTCADAGTAFAPADHYADCPQAEQPAAEPAPVHIGGGANAEDCPACKTSPAPAYPFICPGPAAGDPTP